MAHAYESIAEDLAAGIADGTWPPGTTLPTIPELQKRYRVSRITVRGAIDELEKQGLVFTGYLAGKRGTIVRSQTRVTTEVSAALRTITERRSDHDAFRDSVANAGHSPDTKFSLSVELPPAEVAARLGVATDEAVLVRSNYQMVDGEPWSRERGYYPQDVAREVGLDRPVDIPQGTMRQLAEHGHVEVTHVDELTSEPASAEDAADLSVPVGTPLLVQVRTAATEKRITRVNIYARVAARNRLVWVIGDNERGLELINKAHEVGEQE